MQNVEVLGVPDRRLYVRPTVKQRWMGAGLAASVFLIVCLIGVLTH